VRAAWRRNDVYEVRDFEVSHPVYDQKSVNDPASTKNSCWKDKKRRPEEESRSTWDDSHYVTDHAYQENLVEILTQA
jgi:hypothetical protein